MKTRFHKGKEKYGIRDNGAHGKKLLKRMNKKEQRKLSKLEIAKSLNNLAKETNNSQNNPLFIDKIYEDY